MRSPDRQLATFITIIICLLHRESVNKQEQSLSSLFWEEWCLCSPIDFHGKSLLGPLSGEKMEEEDNMLEDEVEAEEV